MGTGGRSSCPHPAKVSPGDTGIHLSLVPTPSLLHVQVVRHIPTNSPSHPVAFPLSCSQLRPPFQKKPNPHWALTPCSVPCTSWPLMDRRGLQVQALALGGSEMLRHPVLPWTGLSPQRKQASCSTHPCQPVKLSSSRSTPSYSRAGPTLGLPNWPQWSAPRPYLPATCVHHSAWAPAVFQITPQKSHADPFSTPDPKISGDE